MNTADSAWMLTSTALVLFMVPGLALFYGGLVAEKNVIAMMGKSFVAIGIVSIPRAVVGYSLALGADNDGLNTRYPRKCIRLVVAPAISAGVMTANIGPKAGNVWLPRAR